jgi:hypothetical protein
MTDEIDDQDTTAADAAFASLTEEDLRVRSQELHDTQELWEELAYVKNEKIPCPECSGRGAVSAGSLGDICVRCEGRRVIDRPGSQPLEMPPFRELRAAITAYGNALADAALPEGHIAKRNLALPAASTVPTVDAITALRDDARKQIATVSHREALRLKDARAPREDNDLTANEDSEISDAEIDELEKHAGDDHV